MMHQKSYSMNSMGARSFSRPYGMVPIKYIHENLESRKNM
jgi:hypothetical protein